MTDEVEDVQIEEGLVNEPDVEDDSPEDEQ
jgi:hypothetical protein